MQAHRPSLFEGTQPLVPELVERVVAGRQRLVAEALGRVADLARRVAPEQSLDPAYAARSAACARRRRRTCPTRSGAAGCPSRSARGPRWCSSRGRLALHEEPEQRQPDLARVGNPAPVDQHLGGVDRPRRSRRDRAGCGPRRPGTRPGAAAQHPRRARGTRPSAARSRGRAGSWARRRRRTGRPSGTASAGVPDRAYPPSRRRDARCPSLPSGPPRGSRSAKVFTLSRPMWASIIQALTRMASRDGAGVASPRSIRCCWKAGDALRSRRPLRPPRGDPRAARPARRSAPEGSARRNRVGSKRWRQAPVAALRQRLLGGSGPLAGSA